MGKQMTVYVLGLDYEVKAEIPWDEAVTHILQGKMTLFKADDTRRVRSAGGSVDMPWPLIVRLNYWVQVPRPREISLETRASRSDILRRDGYTCAYCGGRGTTCDHVIPESRGGGWTWGNLVAACLECNQFKADRTPEEAGMKMLWFPHTNRNRFSGVQTEVWKILEGETGGYVEDGSLYEGMLAK